MPNIVNPRSQMPITRRAQEWDPFESMRQLLSWDPFQEMTRRFRGESMSSFIPAFDVKEEKDAFLFKADLPGIQEKDLDINITGNRLTVSGKREEESTEESANWYCSERSYGSFTRTFTLPDSVDSDKVQAEMRDGVLTLRVPKSPEAQPKRIAVKSGNGNGGERAGGEKAPGAKGKS